MPYESCCNQRLKKTPEYLRMLELLDATGKLRIVPNTGIDVKFWKNAGGCREFGVKRVWVGACLWKDAS